MQRAQQAKRTDDQQHKCHVASASKIGVSPAFYAKLTNDAAPLLHRPIKRPPHRSIDRWSMRDRNIDQRSTHDVHIDRRSMLDVKSEWARRRAADPTRKPNRISLHMPALELLRAASSSVNAVTSQRQYEL
jgi:hypothetical protein